MALKTNYIRLGEKLALSTGVPRLCDRIEAEARQEARKIIRQAIQCKSASLFLRIMEAH